MEDYDRDLNVKVMFILLHRWVDERKEQEEVEALREEVSGENEINILKDKMKMRT